MNSVTLTRDEWNTIWSAVKQIRNDVSEIGMVKYTLDDVGLVKAADRIGRRLGITSDQCDLIVRTLIIAEDRHDGEAA